MRRLLFISALTSFVLFSCSNDTKNPNAVSISGTITNHIGDTVKFHAKDTTFITTLDTTSGQFAIEFELDSASNISFFHGVESTAMFVKPGDNIELSIDTEEFDESISYEGSEESTFLAWQYMYMETNEWPDFKKVSEEKLEETFDSFFGPVKEKAAAFKEKNLAFYEFYIKDLQGQIDYLKQRRQVMASLPQPGEDPFDFTFPDRDGNEVSLSGLKGSVVYVDVWAEWCGPCMMEVPFLMKLEEEYHGESIVFLGVNADSKRESWIKVLDEKGMQGTHVTTGGWDNQFMKDYGINSIPRFMVFDKEGKVVDLDAPRPSSEKIRPLLDSLL